MPPQQQRKYINVVIFIIVYGQGVIIFYAGLKALITGTYFEPVFFFFVVVVIRVFCHLFVCLVLA